jgi:hypothetical protein
MICSYFNISCESHAKRKLDFLHRPDMFAPLMWPFMASREEINPTQVGGTKRAVAKITTARVHPPQIEIAEAASA